MHNLQTWRPQRSSPAAQCVSSVEVGGEVDSLLLGGSYLFVGLHKAGEGIIKVWNMSNGSNHLLTGHKVRASARTVHCRLVLFMLCANLYCAFVVHVCGVDMPKHMPLMKGAQGAPVSSAWKKSVSSASATACVLLSVDLQIFSNGWGSAPIWPMRPPQQGLQGCTSTQGISKPQVHQQSCS